MIDIDKTVSSYTKWLDQVPAGPVVYRYKHFSITLEGRYLVCWRNDFRWIHSRQRNYSENLLEQARCFCHNSYLLEYWD